MLAILVTPTFARAIKKLPAKDKLIVDKAVKAIAADASIGKEKKGDLAGVLVYKFKINQQDVLLAYRLQPNQVSPLTVLLLNLGSHENFYAELKRLT